MRIYINLKSAGKRRPCLEKSLYVLPDGISSLRQLIEAIVLQETDRYNKQGEENMLVPFLTETEIANQSISGKVGFGQIYSNKKADPIKSVETALNGFEDGLFRVIVGGTEITQLDTPLEIQDGDVLTFIRLTFLAGRLW